MAQVMICDGCNTQAAVIIVQLIGTPEVLAFCAPCSGQWAEGHAAAMAELFPSEETGPAGEAGNVDPGADTDTPQSGNAAETGAGTPQLPGQGDDQAETTEGGGADGRLRAHDRGPDGGDRPASSGAGPDDAGKDQGGGQGGGGSGGGGRAKQRGSARDDLEPHIGP